MFGHVSFPRELNAYRQYVQPRPLKFVSSKLMTKKRITTKKRSYTKEAKQQAAIEYAVTGSYTMVSKALDIPKKTVHWWSTNWDGWDATIAQVQTEKAEQHRAQYAAIVEKAQAVVLAKLPEATAAQANIIAATSTDKVRLLDNMPTTISAKQDSMESMAERFRLIANEIKANTIPVNLIDVTPEDKG